MADESCKPTREELEAKLSTVRELVIVWDFEKALALLSEIQDGIRRLEDTQELEVDTLAEQGKLYWKKGTYDEAEKLLDKAISLGTSFSYDGGKAYALNYKGNLQWSRGNFKDAEHLYLESLELRSRIGDDEGVATSLLNLGLIYSEVGELSKAIDHYKKSIELSREIDTIAAKSTLVITLNNLAGLYRKQGELEKAEPIYLNAKELSHKIGKRDGEALCLTSLGILAWARGNLQVAKTRLNESRLMWEELRIQNLPYLRNLTTLAGVFTDLGEFINAEKLLSTAQSITEISGSSVASMYVTYHQGYLQQSRGNVASARKYFDTCLLSAKEHNKFEFTLKSLIGLALIDCLEFRLSLDDQFLERTQNRIQQILDSADEQYMISSQADAKIIQGMLRSATMDYIGALETLMEVLKLAEEKGLPRQAANAREQIEKIKHVRDRANKAIKPVSQSEQIEEVKNYLARYQDLLKAFKS